MTLAFHSDSSDLSSQAAPPSFFDASSRIGRAQFVVIALAGSVPLALLMMYSGVSPAMRSDGYWSLNLLSIALTVLAGTRRAADIGVTRWAAGGLLVPFICLPVFAWMAGAPGSASANQHGEPPAEHGSGMTAAAVMLLVFILVGVVYAATRGAAY